MGKINMGRVLLGGLLAGIIIDAFEGVLNGVVLADRMAEYLRSINKPGAFSTSQLIWFNLIGLAFGIAAVRLYAVARPRFGAGPATAVRAGIALWVIGFLLPGIINVVGGLAPLNLTLIALAVQIVETVVAALAGAALYKESAEPAARAVASHA